MFFLIFLPNTRWACFSVELPILSLFFKFACLFLQNNLASLLQPIPVLFANQKNKLNLGYLLSNTL